ncbi:MAG: DUF424 domain-containing protein [Candidatus Micrarchaeota archaeon]
MKKHWMKKHVQGGHKVLAACDKELLGKVIKSQKLSLNVSEYFYKGELVDEDTLIEEISKGSNINIIGKQTVGAAKKLFSCETKQIKGVPYAIILRF